MEYRGQTEAGLVEMLAGMNLGGSATRSKCQVLPRVEAPGRRGRRRCKFIIGALHPLVFSICLPPPES